MSLENIIENPYSSNKNIEVLFDIFKQEVFQLEKQSEDKAHGVIVEEEKIEESFKPISEDKAQGVRMEEEEKEESSKPISIAIPLSKPISINNPSSIESSTKRKVVDPFQTPTERNIKGKRVGPIEHISFLVEPVLAIPKQNQKRKTKDDVFGSLQPAIQRSKSNPHIGGQKGGDCRNITFDAFIVLFAYKLITEYVHDIGSGDRGAAVKNTDIYSRVLEVFTMIANSFKAGQMGESITDEPSNTWLRELNNEIADIDEDKYMSTIIRAIVTHCPDMVNEFYYKPMYLYVCKYDEKKMTKSQYIVMYELFRDKIIEFFPKDEWMIFVKPDDTKEDIHLYIFKKNIEGAFLSDRILDKHTQDMGLEDIPLGIALKMKDFNHIYDTFVKDNNIDVFFQGDGNINAAYADNINEALQPLESGVIDPGTGEITNSSIQLFTPLKGLDPLNTHKFKYGLIMDMDTPNKPKKLYVGYPPGDYDGFLKSNISWDCVP
jgi:hypothetical protein